MQISIIQAIFHEKHSYIQVAIIIDEMDRTNVPATIPITSLIFSVPSDRLLFRLEERFSGKSNHPTFIVIKWE